MKATTIINEHRHLFAQNKNDRDALEAIENNHVIELLNDKCVSEEEIGD